MAVEPVMTSNKDFEPDLKLTEKQFNDIMLDIAHVTKSKKISRPVYDEEGNFIENEKTHTFIIKNEDLKPIFDKYNIPHVDWDNPNLNSYQSETSILQGIEELTGYNTFPYSREMYMHSSQKAVATAEAEHTDPIDELKRNLKRSEAEWHKETEISFDNIKGKNFYKDDEHVSGTISNQKMSKNLEVAEQISSMYHDNAYVQFLYAAMKVYDEYRRDQVNDAFASKVDFLENNTNYNSQDKDKSSKSWNKGNIADFMNEDDNSESEKEGSFEPK